MKRHATEVCLCVVLATACGSREDAAPRRPDRRALVTVSLPDLSPVPQSVQGQIATQHSSLMQTIAKSGTSDSDLALAYGELGVLLMAAEYRRAAEPCFLDAEALAPTELRWPYYLGHLYRLEGDLTKASTWFQRTLQLQPDNVPALVWLAALEVDLGRTDAAQPLLTKALALQPRSAAALYWLGRVALTRRDYAQAADHLERSLALAKAPSTIQYQLAIAYRGLGDTAKAERFARQIGPHETAPVDPLMNRLAEVLKSWKAYEIKGLGAQQSGALTSAALYFRKAAELAPHEPSPRHHLGTVLFLSGDVAGAVAQFTDALRVAPTFAKAHYSLGVLLASRGETAQAVEALTAAAKSDPNYVEAHLALADILRTSGRWQDAFTEYRRSLNLDPGLAEATLGSAIVLVHFRRYSEARDQLTNAMALHPDRPELAHALVRVLAAAPDDRIRDGHRAMAIMQKVLASETRSVDLAETMAMAAAEIGQYGEAVTWQEQAIRAVERAGLAAIATHMTAALRLYETGKPCRTPWLGYEDLIGLATLPLHE